MILVPAVPTDAGPTDLSSALDEVLGSPVMAEPSIEYASPPVAVEEIRHEPPTKSTAPLQRCQPYTKRAYIHVTCGGKTMVDEGALWHLLNPFRYVNMTICASCGSADLPDNFEWADTRERVSFFRSRVFSAVPLYAKVILFLVVPLLFGIGVYLALPLLPPPGPNGGDPKIIAMLAVPFGFLVGVMAMIMTPLSNLIASMCGVKFNTYK